MQTILRMMAFAVLAVFIGGCKANDTTVTFNPTIEVDEVCAGLLNNSFQSRENLQIIDAGDVTAELPLLVSFLLDGRVVWNYENNESVIGTFECENGHVTAVFTEGSRSGFTGDFDPDTGTIVIDGIQYFILTGV